MTGQAKLELPASGLAEDILARFMVEARAEADRETVSPLSEQREAYHLVTFGLGDESYGVPIESVQEIIRAGDITGVPGAPGHVRGVINLRGRIIPVVDLRKRLGLPRREDSEEQRIMVVDLGVKRLGMLVDSVSQVIKIPAALMEEIPAEAVGAEGKSVMGVGKLDDGLVFVLDLARALLLV